LPDLEIAQAFFLSIASFFLLSYPPQLPVDTQSLELNTLLTSLIYSSADSGIQIVRFAASKLYVESLW